MQSIFAWDRWGGFYTMVLRRTRSLLRAKREPERTAVPAGHESPSGAFKPQTGLQSKCRVFSAARSPLLSRRGRRRVAAPCVCFVPWAALASYRPRPQQLLPVSAAGSGRRRCKSRCKDKKRPVHKCVVTVTPVDIPTGWDPRAKQQPTGLIACGTACRRPVQIPLQR